VGPGFTLLVTGDSQSSDQSVSRDRWVSDAVQAAHDCGLPLSVVREPAEAVREAYGAPLVLVRPDEFVAWACTEGSDLPRHVIDRVRGG